MPSLMDSRPCQNDVEPLLSGTTDLEKPNTKTPVQRILNGGLSGRDADDFVDDAEDSSVEELPDWPLPEWHELV
jgi:hypothetical protein